MSRNEKNIVIAFDKVSFGWPEKPILYDVSFEISSGETHAILGPSGSGKTTLMHLMSGLLKPQKGRVFLFGEDVAKMSRSRLLTLRMRMGVLFQSSGLFRDLSVFENIAFPIRHHMRLREDLIRNMVLLKLEAVGLRNARHLYPSSLSGGMARRIALARAAALDPELLLYDEPFVGQDPISVGVLTKLMRQLKIGNKGTAVIVSHDVDVTLSLADRVSVLYQGKMIFQGSPNLLRKSEDPLVVQFIGGLAEGPVEYKHAGPSLLEEIQ